MKNENLKKERESRGLSQRELARKTGISQTIISQWESGKISPTIDSIIILADFYDISIDELIGRNFRL